MTVPNFTLALDRWASETPDAPALIDSQGTWSYAELNDVVWHIAYALRQAGIAPGTVVAHTFVSELTQAVAMLAVCRLGATVLCLPRSDSLPYRQALAERAGAVAVLADHPAGALPGLPLHQVVPPSRAVLTGRWLDHSVADHEPRSPAVLIVGSGTTGRKKLMPLSHQAIAGRTAILTEMLKMTERDRIACCSPLDYAACYERLFEALCIGASFALLEGRFPEVAAICRREEITILHATVFHAEQMVHQAPLGAMPMLDGLRVLRVGSATVPEALRQRILRCLTSRLYIRLGINEFGPATMAGPDDIRTTPGTVGRPAPQVQLRLLSPEGKMVALGEVGQVWLRGPGMIDGYLDDPEATAAAFREGWFTSHDMAIRQADGQVIHCGRSDHMMIFNGINVSPTEVENVVSLYPGVRDVACVPLRSKVSQNVPICAVALEPGVSVRLDALAQYARDRLGPQRPRDWFVLAAIPRTDRGKLIRPALYERIEAARVARTLSFSWTLVVPPKFELTRLDCQLVDSRVLPATALPPAHDVAGAVDIHASVARALALRVLLLADVRLRSQGVLLKVKGQLHVEPASGDVPDAWQAQTVLPLPFYVDPAMVQSSLQAALAELRRLTDTPEPLN